MKSFTYTITDPVGLHARPVGELARLAGQFPCEITLTRGEDSSSVKKIFAMMTLAVKCGQTVRVDFDGEREDAAYDALKAFFEEKL